MRITFEGDHRSGKGTQIDLYKDTYDPDITVVRGDGSYQGGLEGIASDDEIAFRDHLNERLYKETDKAELLWGIAATACALTVAKPELAGIPLLIDRGPISRAAFLLSRGKAGKELIDGMYPGFTYDMDGRTFTQPTVDIDSIDFGRIVYIQVPTSVLLSRITDDDPKADFRRKNIREKEGLFDRAVESMPSSVRASIEVIDGNQAPRDVLASYAERE